MYRVFVLSQHFRTVMTVLTYYNDLSCIPVHTNHVKHYCAETLVTEAMTPVAYRLTHDYKYDATAYEVVL